MPGASLPRTGPVGRPVDVPPADPAAVRALVEEFQSGILRAERTRPSTTGPIRTDVPEPIRADVPEAIRADAAEAFRAATTEPTRAGVVGPDPAGPVEPTPERPRLSRRVPGANLTVTAPHAPPPSPHPGDPAEVRDLITQFEAGVARALREVSPDRRNEEGSSR
ncbi:hypothetical protein MRQ36_10655 [Micromonospora sp. R77]|uniref:hypothetical protein n=1 Tax=Micromonospora sp. R77 TaxID=2925836 RepID=UPI001F615EEB|nr:hypothetical protein [Micromonospora sp. R77]MCI4063011.1 hypothetical protein [Micromonospora sp. R77]